LDAVKLLLSFVAAGMLFFGAIFLIASVVNPYRILVGFPLLVGGTVIAYRLLKPRPRVVEVKVSWDPSGRLDVEELKCPYCGASLPEPKPGQEFIKCPYCGRTVKLVEEPKW